LVNFQSNPSQVWVVLQTFPWKPSWAAASIRTMRSV